MASAPKTRAEKAIELDPAPDATFKYKRKVAENENSCSIFMSYGLLNRLTKLAENVEQLIGIAAFPELQDKIVRTLLAPKGDDGVPDPDKFSMDRDTDGIAIDDIQKMILWAGGHMSHFFVGLMHKNVGQAAKTKKTVAAITAEIVALTDSNDGLAS